MFLMLTEFLQLDYLAYSLGCLGVVAEWRAYSRQCGQSFRRWSAFAAFLWSCQYCLLNAWTAGLTMLVTALRTLASQNQHHYRNSNYTALGFVLLFCGITIATWQGVISLLPAFAVINTTLAVFYLDNRKMRKALLASSAAWIGNDWYWLVWPALVAEIVVLLINVRTIRKL